MDEIVTLLPALLMSLISKNNLGIWATRIGARATGGITALYDETHEREPLDLDLET